VTVPPSPRIERADWGSVTVEPGGRFRDVKLFPGGAREWDWGETGTHHSPGVRPADVLELVERGARVLVLSRGRLGRLGVAQETLDLLAEQGVEVHMCRTEAAVDLYNRLRRDRPVGALIHSTC
jgi:hypothetical protein